MSNAFYLGDWHVDTAANRLHKDGRDVALENKVMAVLVYLARHPNELVTRESLQSAVWGKTVVGYDTLTRCIAQLRKALRDDSRQPSYIETIPKKGYRLIAPVRKADAGKAVTAPALRPALLIIALLLAPVLMLMRADTPEPAAASIRTVPRSIAVQPFEDLTDNPEEERYFAAGISADITTALAKISGLQVITHTGTAAATPGVRYLLSGSVRRSATQIRINVHLTDRHDGHILWAEQFDGAPSSLFDVQDSITGRIVSALAINLTEEEKRRSARRYTHSVDAYDDFLKGQARYMRHNRESNRLARRYFQLAVTRDPAFARAWAGIALTHVADARYGWAEPTDQALREALTLARKSIALDSELPQAYWVLGYTYLFQRQYEKAAAAAAHALTLDPDYVDSYLTLAVCRMRQGQPADAIPLARKAMQLNPQYPAAYTSVLGQAYYFNHQYASAVYALREAIEKNPNLLAARIFLVSALMRLDEDNEAQWQAELLRHSAGGFRIAHLPDLLAIHDADITSAISADLRRAGL